MASESASAAIALDVGANVIEVVVTAEDGTTPRTYTVTVTRATLPGALTLARRTGPSRGRRRAYGDRDPRRAGPRRARRQ